MLTILEKADLLQSVEIFCEVQTQSLARIATIAHEIHFEPRHRLFSENEAAEAMYVILEGEVALNRGGSQNRILGQFQVAGALALLANQLQPESAAAIKPVRALCISQQDLFDAMTENFGITRGILRALAGKAKDR
jgi:CRP-like cAMP-binding protein